MSSMFKRSSSESWTSSLLSAGLYHGCFSKYAFRSLDWNKALVGGTYVPIEPVTFNGHTTGILSIDGEGSSRNLNWNW